MITERSYYEEWIKQILLKTRSTNYGLAEKMIYAFTLLEQLALNDMPFVFKGGTSLALLMPELHRFSKDIDIQMDKRPNNIENIFDGIVVNSPFNRWEHSQRESEFDVPKEHFKFYYTPSRPGRFTQEPILLDILYGESSYPTHQKIGLSHTMLITEEPLIEITVPTIEGITGDKLTAFAPRTLGIPFGKNKSVEIIKQLFDLNQLLGYCRNWSEIEKSFRHTVKTVAVYYKKNVTPAEVVDDIIQTAFILGMKGKVQEDQFIEMKQGIDGLNNYLMNRRFTIPDAITASARIARLALSVKLGINFEPIDFKRIDPNYLKKLNLIHPTYNTLNKPLKKGFTEAWLEWVEIEKLVQNH
jgi:hypothetical protein